MPQAPKPTAQPEGEAASTAISRRIADLGDWRGATLARVRHLIQDADPNIQEEWKWAKPTSPGIPVWSCHGGICTGEVYKSAVKLTFFRGAALQDPENLFNSSLGAPEKVVERYKSLADIERGFKVLKSELEIGPVPRRMPRRHR